MSLLHLLTLPLDGPSRRTAIYRSLARLDDRALADLDLARDEIAAVARLGAEAGAEGASLAEIVARVRLARSGPSTLSAGRRPLAYSPADIDRYQAQAQRLRSEALAASWRWLGRRLADLVRPASQALLASAAGRWVRARLVWSRAYRRTRAELETYSDRELAVDLRRSRSDIGALAAEAADERLLAHLAADQAAGRTRPGRVAARHAPG